MQSYLPYNPQSTIRVEEQIQVADNKAFLRHIPKEGSIQIDGFTETDNPDPASGQFFCDYAKDTLYRDANRVLRFHGVDDFTQITVSYIAIGTVITADDMNEIKAHLENKAIHGGDAQFLGFLDVGDDWNNPSLKTAFWGQYFKDPKFSSDPNPETGAIYLFDGFNWRCISNWAMVPVLFAQGSYAHENDRYCPGDLFELGNRQDGKFGLYFIGSKNITGDPSVRIDSPEWVYGYEENDDNKIYFTALNGDTLALSDCDALEARIAALEAKVAALEGAV